MYVCLTVVYGVCEQSWAADAHRQVVRVGVFCFTSSLWCALSASHWYRPVIRAREPPHCLTAFAQSKLIGYTARPSLRGLMGKRIIKTNGNFKNMTKNINISMYAYTQTHSYLRRQRWRHSLFKSRTESGR